MKIWLSVILFLVFCLTEGRTFAQEAGEGGEETPVVPTVTTVRLKLTPDPVNRVFKGGEDVTFGTEITFAGTAFSYETAWRKIGRSDVLSTEPSLTLEKMTAIESGKYYCIIKETGTATVYNSDTLEIKVVDTKVNAYGFTRLCLGDSVGYGVAVSDTFEYAYTWYHLPQTDPIGHDEFYKVNPVTEADAGLYYCEVVDQTHGFVFLSDTLDVRVSAYPTIGVSVAGVPNNADKAFAFCYGTEVTLTIRNEESGQPEARFLWTGSAIEGNSGDASVKVNLRHSGVYRAMITHNGCVREDSVTLTMVRPDVLLPETRYVIEGESITLQSFVSETGYTYSWTNGTTTGVSSDAAYTFTAVKGKTVVALQVRTDDALRCENSDTCYVVGLPKLNYTTSVNDGYVVSRGPLDILQTDTTLCARQPLTLEVAYTGYDGYTYEWMKIEGETTSPVDTGRIMYIASAVQTSGAGVRYFCRAYDLEKNGYAYSDTVKVVVKYTPVASITDPDETTGQCGGYPLTLKGKDAGVASDLPITNYTWQGSGIQSGAHRAELQIRVGVNGYYTLEMEVDGCRDTADIHIPTIIHTVDIAAQLILPQPTDNVLFTAAKPDEGILTWYPNGDESRKFQNAANPAQPSASLNILRGDSLVVVKMENQGCSYYDTCIVLLRQFIPSEDEEVPDDGFAISYPILRVTSTVPRVCLGRDITLSVYDLGYDNYKYEWRKVGSPDLKGLSDSISYTIFHADANAGGRYYCVATDPEDPATLIYSDTLLLTVDEGPLAEIADSRVSLCYGEIVEIRANTPYSMTPMPSNPSVADQLLWSGEGIVDGQGTNVIRVKVGETAYYRLRASKNGACWSEDTISFRVVKPAVSIHPPLTFLSKNGTVEMEAVTEQTTYTWYKDGVEDERKDGKLTFDFAKDGIVSLIVGEGNCRAMDTARVFIKDGGTFGGGENDGFVISQPALSIPSGLKNIYACPDTLLIFHIDHQEYPNYKYQWWKVTGTTPTLVWDGSRYAFNVREEDGGEYYCTAVRTDAAQGADTLIYSDTLYLQVNIGPIAQIAYNDLTVCVSGSLHLDAAASANGTSGTVTYAWSGEGVSAEESGLSAIDVSPKQDGIYTVRVSNSGCSDTASVNVKVVNPRIGLPVRLQLAAPDPTYRVEADIPEGVSVRWSFRSAGTGEVNTTPEGEDYVNITGDGWILAEGSSGDGCTRVDSCLVFVHSTAAFSGGEDDGFGLLEVNTRVWIEPQQKEIELCLNNRLSLKAVVSGLSRYMYSWHRLEDDTADKTGPARGTEAELNIDYMNEELAGNYYCVVTDMEDISSEGLKRYYYSDTVQVKIKPGPLATIVRKDGDLSWDACVGNEIELEAGVKNGFSAAVYEWSGDYYETTLDPKIITAKPHANGAYLLTVRDEKSGCQDTLHIQFKMHAPEVHIPATYLLAKPGAISIPAEVNGAGDFTWYLHAYQPGNSIGSDNPADITVSKDETVIVRFEQEGCYGFDTAKVYVKSPGTFAGNEDDGFAASDLMLNAWLEKTHLEVCRGWDIQIPLHVAEVGRVLRYKWYKVGDAGHKVLSEEDTLVLRANSMDDAGKYYCVIADPAIQKTITSDTAEVTMINGPLAEISRPSAADLQGIFCRGGDVTVSAAATESKKVNNSDVYSYEWFGENISYTARDYEVSARMANNGRYIVKASLGECYTYDTVDMEIYEPEVHIQPVIFLSKADDILLAVDNPDKNTINWRLYYNLQPGTEILRKEGDTLRQKIYDNAFVIVERYESRCVGYDTCRIFVRDERAFKGKEDDGFMTGGSGFYNKLITYTDVVCEGEVGTLYIPVVGDDFYRYKWIKVGEEGREFPSSPMCKFPHVTKQDEGYYYCIVTDVNNNKTLTSERVFMEVKELPKSVIKELDDTELCYGETVTLEADPSQLKPEVAYSYLWSGKGIGSRITATTEVKVEEDGQYTLLVSDGDCYISDTVSIQVRKTHLDIEPVYHIKKGDALTLQGKVNGSVLPLLNWRVGTNYYEKVNPLALTATSLTQSTPFTVSTTDKCAVTREGYIYVRENTAYEGGSDDGYVLPNNLPQLLDQCDQLLGCDVDTAVLWVTAIKTEDLTFRWERYSETGKRWEPFEKVTGDNHISGIDSARLIFSYITDADAGRYRCRLLNTYGYTYSREVRLVKGGIPDIRPYPLFDNQVCEKTEFRFVTDVDISHGGNKNDTGLKWKWYYSKDGINFTQLKPEVDYNNQSLVVKPCQESDEGYYMVEAENFCGSVYDTAFQEIWEAPVFVEQPTDRYVCNWGTLELTTKVKGGGTYFYSLWQVEVDERGNYVRDIRRVKKDLTVPSYIFGPAVKNDQTDDSGYYQWRVRNQCDSARSNLFRITVEEEIQPNFVGIDTTVCAGVGGNLVMETIGNVETTPTMKYTWKKNGTEIPGATDKVYTIVRVDTSDAGVYICYAGHSCAAKPIKQYHVRTKSRPQIVLQPSVSREFCESGAVELKVDYTSDAGPVTCQWQHNNTNVVDNDRISGAQSYKLNIDTLYVSDGGWYSVNLRNECELAASQAVWIQVNEPARFSRSLEGQDLKLCVGSNATLKVTATGLAPIVYTWWKDGERIEGANLPTLSLVGVNHDASGTYKCSIQNTCSQNEGEMSETTVEVITPKVYQVEGAGGYCGEDFREITLSGFERGVTYVLKRRSALNATDYRTLKTVKGDTVSTSKLTFGYWGSGYYHVEATATAGGASCGAGMSGEIYIFQKPTPKQFDFIVSDPMCTGELFAELTLTGSETDTVEYYIQNYTERFGGSWGNCQSVERGTEGPIVWNRVSTGIYRVMALHRISGCQAQMGKNDTVAVRPYPTAYDLFAVNGDTTACFGMKSDVVLQLSDSEKTCKYTLYKDGKPTDRTLTGNLIQWDDVKGGNYSVHAVTDYGCIKDMGDVTVTDLPQLKPWFLTGDKVFCEEESGDKHYVMLQGSTPGIRYNFYAHSNGQLLDSLYGNGEFLVWEVPLEKDEIYYVEAVDTLEGCIQVMTDSAHINANRLNIGIIPDTTIINSTRAELWVEVRNAMGTPQVTWLPADKVVSLGEDTYNVSTVIMKAAELFAVKVEDDYCVQEGTVQVNVEGQELIADLRASDCFTSLDTLFLCEGEDVNLCAFVSGGGKDYYFSWSDDYYTDSIPVAPKSRISYTRHELRDGFVRLEVNSVYQDVLQTSIDTVWIRMRKRPDIFLENNALTCVVPGTDTAIVLSSTEAEVEYQLNYRPLQTVAYVLKDTIMGDGTQRRFPVTAYSDADDAGFYQLKAIRTYPETTCITTWPAIQLRRGPRRQTVSSGEITVYCADERRDTIYVPDTETDVVYHLIRNRKFDLAQQTGNGGELRFTGAYGTGIYQVTAVLGNCIDTMRSTVDIQAKPRPIIDSIRGMLDYCVNDAAHIKATVAEALPVVSYTLYKEGFFDKIAQGSTGLGGEEIELPLTAVEGLDELTGNYFVVAYDPANQCSDTVRGMSVTPSPGDLTLNAFTYTYCDNLPGYEGKDIVVTGADPLIRYELMDQSLSNKFGDFVAAHADTIVYDGLLSVEGTNATYKIYAKAGSCSGVKGSFEVKKSIAPADVALLGDTLGCDGFDLTLGVATPALGVKYSLYREGEAEPLRTLTGGSGGVLQFGTWHELGTYYVVATNAQGCERRLSQEYRIRELPQSFRIYAANGATSYCEGDRGVQLGITGTQFGVSYFIQKWDTLRAEYRDVLNGELAGSGSNAILFPGYYKSGSYRIRTNYCNITMLDTLEISERPLPLAVGLKYEGRACIDSTMSVMVEQPEEGTNYTLLYNGTAVEAAALPGSAEVKWTLSAAQDGTYTVSAEKNSCSLLLTDKIVPGEVAKIGDLQGIVSTICEMEKADLYLEEWESKAVYTLSTKTDTVRYKGIESEGKIVFKGIPAGYDYYVTAAHRSCEIEKGAFEFHGVGLPELPEGSMLASDCGEEGEAAIALKDLKPTYQYTLEGLSQSYKITTFAGDTLIRGVDYGTYSLRAYDPLTTCTSQPLKAIVRIGVPQDSIVSDLVYCEGGEGVKIRLSGQTYGVLYKLLNAADGSEVEHMSSSTTFNRYLSGGKYVYYRERTGLWGGCWATDTFQVEEYPYPNASLQLEMPEGTLCEAGDNAIIIRNSEKDVHYILQNTLTKANLDTIYGNGDPVAFTGRKPVGTYNILIRYKGVCEKMYYKSLAVSPVPAKAVASDCEYCLDTEGRAGQGCDLSISGLKPSAEYVLFNKANEPLDTLYGVNAGSFKTMPAGDYYVVGTYTDTRCADMVAEMSVHRLTQPKVYPIGNMNGEGDCAASVQVTLSNGCEGDSVKYYLYMDGFYKVQGPVTAEGNLVIFDNFTQPGKYSVYAVKGEEEKCGTWMEGDIVLYDRPKNGSLYVNGYNCSNITNRKQVTIRADKTEFNWMYYISDGVSESVKQEGNPNTMLSWDEINGLPLKSGQYVLYARNTCDSVIAMDTAWVYDAAAPTAYALKRIREGVACGNEGYECYLDGSEKGVTYILNFHKEDLEIAGQGNGELYLGNVAPTAQAGDTCRIYARVDSSQCVYAMDSLVLITDTYAEDPGFDGSFSNCIKEGDTIAFKLLKQRVPLLDYYLELNGHMLDTIHGDDPPAIIAFKAQREVGCYNVYATSKTRQCDKVYPAKCISMAPEVRTLRTDWDGELCEGESHEIVLEEPQMGVQYYLQRNGTILGDSVHGNEETLVVGSVSEAGRYTVVARVTDECTADMEGEVNVKVNPLPELHIPHELNYVEGGEGVKIVVQAPTSPDVFYQLNDESGKLLYWSKAAPDGGPVALNGNDNEFNYKAGKYIVSAYSTPGGEFKCTATDTVEVKEVGVEKFRLEVIGNPYMCEPNECRRMQLNGSEKGTYYELYRRSGETTVFVASAAGTGKVIDFAEQCDTGYYYVMASREIVNGTTGKIEVVESRMGEEVHLYVVSKIERFNLVAAQNGYCYQDPATGKPAEPSGSVILQGSQSDLITYKLYCNGLAVPGGALTGTAGGVLRWDKLSGKTCIKNTDVGNVYTVIATDGKCEVEMPGSVNIIAVNKPTLVQQPADMLTCTGQVAAMIVQVDGCLLNYEWSTRDRVVSTPEGDVVVKGKVVSTTAGYKIDSVGMEDMGIYDCKVSNYCGEMEGFVPVQVSVREVVRIPEEMPDRMVCGSTADSVQMVSAAVGENYYWYRAGSPLDTLSQGLAVYTIHNVEEARDAGDYVCCTWNSCGALYDTIRLEFNRQPEVTGFVYHEDTLCKGTEFRLNVSSRDTLYWYRNDQLMKNKHDFSLQFDSILPQHAGLYKVVAKNQCLESEFNIIRLYVDDTLQPVRLPEALKHYCIGTNMEIGLEFQPSERIHYKWYKRNIEMEQVRDKNTYSQTVSNRDDGAVFGIEYANKCTSGFVEHIVNVDRAISLANFAGDSIVSVCAGPGEAEIVIKDVGQDIASYDQYRWYKQTADGPLAVSETDTLRIDRKVSESGIFYCEVSNTCANVVSGKVDLRVDSLPVILTQPVPANPYCQNTTLEMKMKAQGGDLVYTWYAWKKTAEAPELVSHWKEGTFVSEAKCTLKNLSLDMDSSRVWCIVENECGYVISDTVIVRVNEEVRLTADREIAYLCPGEKAKLVLKPSLSECVRWEYSYARDYGTVIPKSVYAADDTLRLTEEGIYRVFDFLTRDLNCYAGDDTLTVKVMPHDLFYASLDFIGRDTVCRGEPVYLKLSLREGEGPWRVDIRRRRDDVTAPEIGGVPVDVWQRDTVFELTLVENQNFYIASAVQFTDPDACAGIVEGKDAGFVIQQRYGTYIGNDGTTHFGACQELNLAQLLQPYPDVTIGKFYIDGRLSEDGILKGDAGQYRVVYKAETSAGCADSAQIDLWLDTLPSVALSIDKENICTGGVAYLNAQFSGSGGFKYTLRTITYQSNGSLAGRPATSSGTSDNYVTYPISYNENLNAADSLRLYTIVQVIDQYGCRVVPTDTVELFCRKSPRFLLHSQDPESGDFIEAKKEYYLSRSDNRGLYFEIMSDPVSPICPPWMSYIDYTRSADGTKGSAPLYMPDKRGRLYQALEPGKYEFTVTDAYCPSKQNFVCNIISLDTGYLQTRVLLQGAYNSSKALMESALWPNLLPNTEWGGKWPDLGTHKGIDWVTLELRTDEVNGPVYFSGQFLLRDDGWLVDRYGRTTLPVPNADFTKTYYVVIKHRNHLPIGARQAVSLGTKPEEAQLKDMRLMDQVYFAQGDEVSLHIVFLGQMEKLSVFGMYAGNVLGNALVSMSNANKGILEEITTPGYYEADVNFDGKVTVPGSLADPDPRGGDDVSIMYWNRDKYSDIK